MSALSALLAELWPYIAGLVGLVGGWFYAKSRGRKEERDASELESAKALNEATDVDRKWDTYDSDARRARRERWVRNKTRR